MIIEYKSGYTQVYTDIENAVAIGNDPWDLYSVNDNLVKSCDGTEIIYHNEDYAFHRLDGPAHTYFCPKYKKNIELWYYNGYKIDCDNQKQFEKLVKLMVFR